MPDEAKPHDVQSLASDFADKLEAQLPAGHAYVVLVFDSRKIATDKGVTVGFAANRCPHVTASVLGAMATVKRSEYSRCTHEQPSPDPEHVH